jgi:DNA-nicking Smr family endonuclease
MVVLACIAFQDHSGYHAACTPPNPAFITAITACMTMSTSDPQDDPLTLFRSAVADAVPIKQVARVDLSTSSSPTPGQLRRREAAVLEAGLDPNPLSSEPPMLFGPHDLLEFRREGVQYGVFRKLKQGGYELESRLDLHRLFVEQAREAVFTFVNDCMANDLRTVLILHGKGEFSETPAKLKNCVAHWLKALDAVQAYASAQPQHGGAGALYVMLKKSERSKQATALQYRR